MRTFPLCLAILAAPVAGQSAPALTGVAIVSVGSTAGVERITPGQTDTQRHHAPGPVSIVIEESGIGGARVTMIDGEARSLPSSTRPLCGPQRAAGACTPGQPIGGLEITYRVPRIAPGQTFTFRDRSASGPGAPIETAIMIR
ncbi:DUF4879 domain-containing protein [Sphingomonas sp.]|uniref:DUF4879 domain-containing protein n=1 Tax=Sphingomonas sp. TaxID=28214 RepID=UPI00258378D8|nr:DUF4879 domain-containing protein [Sphingomonas sp.]